MGHAKFHNHRTSATKTFKVCFLPYEPRCEKTGLRGFRPGPTQTGLYKHTRLLEA